LDSTAPRNLLSSVSVSTTGVFYPIYRFVYHLKKNSGNWKRKAIENRDLTSFVTVSNFNNTISEKRKKGYCPPSFSFSPNYFAKGVNVRKNNSRLACDSLAIIFNETLQADGQYLLRM
jgi:hypothetical protein